MRDTGKDGGAGFGREEEREKELEARRKSLADRNQHGTMG